MASLGLQAVGQDGLDVQLAHGALELGMLDVFRIMLGEDARAVAVQDHETAVLAGVTLQAVQVGGGATWHTAAPRDDASGALIAHSPGQALDLSHSRPAAVPHPIAPWCA